MERQKNKTSLFWRQFWTIWKNTTNKRMNVRVHKTKSRNLKSLATKSCYIAAQALEGRGQLLQFITCNLLPSRCLTSWNKLVILRRSQDFQSLEWCVDFESKDFAWCRQRASTSSFMNSSMLGWKNRVLVSIVAENQLEFCSNITF